jgi:hypothetical protein
MRHLSLIGLAGAAWAMAGCLDHTTGPSGPDTALALHFDSLSAEASAGSQENRVAALDLVLRSLADGAIPGTLILSTGPDAHDTATYNTATWSSATLKAVAGGDSVTDSLNVFLGWRGADADTMVVLRTGDTKLAPQVQSELARLGLTNGLVTSDTTDTLTSGGFITGNTVAVADSGSIAEGSAIFGAACAFVSVSSLANDASAARCNRELLLWTFGVRFSPSVRLALTTPSYSPGVVVQR